MTIRAGTIREGAVAFRRAVPDDAAAVADVYLAAYRSVYAFPLAHSDDEVRGWIASRVVPGLETWVAEADGEVVAMLVLDETMLDQLYVRPDRQGEGIGSALVDLAKARRPAGLDLYTFQVNDRARRLYERHGFEVVALGDGSGNDERQPDVRYRWRP